MLTQTENKRADTEEAATALRVKANTMRRSHCLMGHYMGMRPVKLPNGRLMWPIDEIERLLSGGSK
jgi:hypothetical protein